MQDSLWEVFVLITMVCIDWEQFENVFPSAFKDVDNFLNTQTEYSLSMRCPDWCIRIDHDHGSFVFDYMGDHEIFFDCPSGPHLFQVNNCPYLTLSSSLV